MILPERRTALRAATAMNDRQQTAPSRNGRRCPVSAPRMSRIKAEHPAWTIERTPDRSTIGYTATRNPEGEVGKVRAVSLTELEKRLRGLDERILAADA